MRCNKIASEAFDNRKGGCAAATRDIRSTDPTRKGRPGGKWRPWEGGCLRTGCLKQPAISGRIPREQHRADRDGTTAVAISSRGGVAVDQGSERCGVLLKITSPRSALRASIAARRSRNFQKRNAAPTSPAMTPYCDRFTMQPAVATRLPSDPDEWAGRAGPLPTHFSFLPKLRGGSDLARRPM